MLSQSFGNPPMDRVDRVHSTTRLVIEGEALDTIEAAPISEVMRVSTAADTKVTKMGDVL